jgi:non-homologous end joining protein Ku
MREEMEEDHSSVNQRRITEIVNTLEETNSEELESVTQTLSKITNLPSEQIKPCLHSMMENLIELRELSFDEKVTPDEWSQAFTKWVESHRSLDLPHLSDDAISRESLYGERG